MPRNRIIYQSEALYAGPCPSTGNHFTGADNTLPLTLWNTSGDTNLIKQLQRVQTANYSFNVDRTDVNQFGQLAAIDRVILKSPTVALDFNYLLGNLSNESTLGFTIQTTGSDALATAEVSCISGILNKTQDDRNYFIKTTSEGTDAVGGTTTGAGVISIGNGFLTSYSHEASVGNFPTASVNVEALNMRFDTSTSGRGIPAINPIDGNDVAGKTFALPFARTNVGTDTSASGISALRPGDITVELPSTIGATSSGDNQFNIQSYKLNFDLGRTPIERLGSKFAFTREINFPVTVNLSIDAQVTDLTTGSLTSLIANDSTIGYNPIIRIKRPGTTDHVAKFSLKNAKLDSQDFKSDIGSNKSVTLNFSSQIGGPEDKQNGLFISGKI
jgi:hypothetical protein